jgi:hypothetical protein
MRRFPIILAVVVSALTAAAGAEPSSRPLLGIVGGETVAQLARVDAVTLRPLPGRVPLANHRSGWSFSPDHRTVALGDDNESCTSGRTSVRFVDFAAMRTLGDVPLVRNGPVTATFWPDSSHVLALVDVGDCIVTNRSVVAAIDATSRRVLRTTDLRGDVVATEHAPGRLVLLLAPRGRIGAARLAVVDARGKVRQTALRGIRAGQTPGGTARPVSNIVQPGLAVDPTRGRAFVVPAGDRLAEIDLGSLRVAYRDLSEQRSAFARLRDWLDPPARAKGANGPIREAVWLGGGTLAVTGIDETMSSTSSGSLRMSSVAAGLRLVDTRRWTYRSLDGGVSRAVLAGGLLLATGSSYRDDGNGGTVTGAGLIAYSVGGVKRYSLFSGRSVLYAAAAGHEYLTVEGSGSSRSLAFDARTGRTGRAVPTGALWRLLSDPAPSP